MVTLVALHDEETDMSHYCGIDCSNNHLVVVTGEEDKRVLEKRFNADAKD